jgi:intelectin
MCSAGHVPDGTPMDEWYGDALYRYYTENGFLDNNGGTLQGVYAKYPPRDGGGSGPEEAVAFDKGTASGFHSNDVAPNSQGESNAGYISFSQGNCESYVSAICPGVQYTGCNTEHACIGGRMQGGYSSDFADFDHEGYGTFTGWSTSKRIVDATVLIFTRSASP